MIWCDRLKRTDTASVTSLLDKWMLDFGYPCSIRTDGGPQFRTAFKEWCKAKNIIHEVSSPYNPQSNGHAENAVKIAKYLMKKTNSNLANFKEALFAWRNMPRADGFSPSDLFFGRRLRSASLPSIRKSTPQTYADAVKLRKSEKEKRKATDNVPPLLPGTPVVLQSPMTKRWSERATILAPRRQDNRSYTVENDDGAKIRTKKHIKFDETVRVKVF